MFLYYGGRISLEWNNSGPNEYCFCLQSGNFVLLKTDVTWDGDTVKSKASEINLWKIDGKALLQKYIPLENNGKTLHKCTCVVSNTYFTPNDDCLRELLCYKLSLLLTIHVIWWIKPLLHDTLCQCRKNMNPCSWHGNSMEKVTVSVYEVRA